VTLIAAAVLVAVVAAAVAAVAAAPVVVAAAPVVGLGFVVVGFVVSSSAQCNAAPIPNFDLEDFPHPYPQRSEEPSVAELHPAMILVACSALSAAGPSAWFPVWSSPLLACACPPPPLRVASCAWIHPLPPTEREAQEAGPAAPWQEDCCWVEEESSQRAAADLGAGCSFWSRRFRSMC
jgi:hypothetical protein